MPHGGGGLHHGCDTPSHSQGPTRKLLLVDKENDEHIEAVEAHCVRSEIFSRVHNFIFRRAEPDHVIVCQAFQMHFLYRAL